jgi:hypothetical protein
MTSSRFEPAEAWVGTAEQRLGDCLAVFPVRRALLIGGIVFAIVNACLGAFIMSGSVFVPVKPRVNPTIQHGLFLGVGAFVVLGSAYALYVVARHIGLRVALHRRGIAIFRGDRASVIPWDQIQSVSHKLAANLALEDTLGSVLDGSQSVYTLRTTSGDRFVLDSFLRDYQSLGNAIRRETTLRLLPQALHIYRVAGRVEFGKLAISLEGLSKGSKMLPWYDVGRVVLQNGYVLVKKRNGRVAWFGVRMNKVLNLYVYLALAEQILDSQRI